MCLFKQKNDCDNFFTQLFALVHLKITQKNKSFHKIKKTMIEENNNTSSRHLNYYKQDIMCLKDEKNEKKIKLQESNDQELVVLNYENSSDTNDFIVSGIRNGVINIQDGQEPKFKIKIHLESEKAVDFKNVIEFGDQGKGLLDLAAYSKDKLFCRIELYIPSKFIFSLRFTNIKDNVEIKMIKSVLRLHLSFFNVEAKSLVIEESTLNSLCVEKGSNVELVLEKSKILDKMIYHTKNAPITIVNASVKDPFEIESISGLVQFNDATINGYVSKNFVTVIGSIVMQNCSIGGGYTSLKTTCGEIKVVECKFNGTFCTKNIANSITLQKNRVRVFEIDSVCGPVIVDKNDCQTIEVKTVSSNLTGCGNLKPLFKSLCGRDDFVLKN